MTDRSTRSGDTPVPRPLAVARAAIVLCCLCAGSAAGVTDAQKCEAALEKVAGKFAQCRLKAESRFSITGSVVGMTRAVATCAERLGRTYDTLFARWGGSCPATEPVGRFEAYLRQCTAESAAAAAGGSLSGFCGDGAIRVGEQCDGGDLGGATCSSLGYAGGMLACTAACAYEPSGCTKPAMLVASGQTSCWDADGGATPCTGTGQDGEAQAGAMLSYVDNGDGTVTDENTGLVWEKLSDDGSVHDRDQTYSWPDTFPVKVAALNAGSGFAGYTDWRMPNVKELQSIVDHQRADPAASPAFDTGCASGCTVLTCSCSAPGSYWSSSTWVVLTSHAWYVSSGQGSTWRGDKTAPLHVRAVRGGS